jgi:hypothetical protein
MAKLKNFLNILQQFVAGKWQDFYRLHVLVPGRVDIICKASIQFLAELNTELKNFMFARLEGLRKEGEGGGRRKE